MRKDVAPETVAAMALALSSARRPWRISECRSTRARSPAASRRCSPGPEPAKKDDVARTLLPSLLALLLTSCLPPPSAPLGATVKQQAPPGTFTATTTFDLQPTFDALDGGRSPEAQSNLTLAFTNGAAKAEAEFRRDTFLTNPRLANRTAPPRFTAVVSVDSTEKHGPFYGVSGTLRVLDHGGTVIEEATVGASVNEKGDATEGLALQELGYRVGAYMVCRTSDDADRCASRRAP